MSDERRDTASGDPTTGTDDRPGLAMAASCPIDETGDVRGTVRVAPAVLIELIELTVRDVPGVVGCQPWRRAERVLPHGVPGRGGERHADAAGSYEAGGVRVRVDGDRIDADVSIVVARGVNVLELSRAIQRRVGVAAGRMLGLTVTEVNVFIADVEADAERGD